MDLDNLIDMANRIGDFFDSLPDQHEATDSIADHIRRFWAPRMRTAILNSLEDPAASAAMSKIVREALEEHRADLTPAVAA
jgi:formate dehydrogenase subunit delta